MSFVYRGQSLCQLNEIDKLIELTPQHGFFLEIGSADGVTAGMIARARPAARVVSIDPLLGDWGLERIPNWMANRETNQHLWIGEVDTFHLFCSARFDVIFVDGDHRYKSAFSDINYAMVMLNPGGVIAVHDYNHYDWYQVTMATDRILMDRTEWKIIELITNLALIKRVPTSDSN